MQGFGDGSGGHRGIAVVVVVRGEGQSRRHQCCQECSYAEERNPDEQRMGGDGAPAIWRLHHDVMDNSRH